MTEQLLHSFNPQVAEVYGINAALIFQYISFRSSRNPSRWCNPTLEEVCKQYPYLGEWQVWAALQKLINAGRKTPPLICRKMVNGVYLYRPITNDTATNLHVFDVRIAVKVGVVPSIIYHNIGYWIRENWSQRAQVWYERLNPDAFDGDDRQMQQFAYQMTRGAAAHFTTASEWAAQHIYISRACVDRGFICLQRAGLLRKGPRRRHKQFWYLTRTSLNVYEQEMLSRRDLGNSICKTQSHSSKPKVIPQNPKSFLKTQTKQGLSRYRDDSSDGVREALVREAELRFENHVDENFDAFRPAGTASSAGASPSVVSEELRRMNCPNQPGAKIKVLRDAFGHPVKRSYIRRPTPDDPEYNDYIEDLTPEERTAYEASFGS